MRVCCSESTTWNDLADTVLNRLTRQDIDRHLDPDHSLNASGERRSSHLSSSECLTSTCTKTPDVVATETRRSVIQHRVSLENFRNHLTRRRRLGFIHKHVDGDLAFLDAGDTDPDLAALFDKVVHQVFQGW